MTLSIENQLTFAESFGSHNLTVTGVQHARTFNGYSSNVRASGFEYENLNTLQNANSYDNVTGYITPVRWSSYLGRVMYDYSGKYLLTASMRWDGNSRFGPGNRWGTFPSASAAWKLNEDLLPNVDAIDMLKLRAGYGKTGNSNIGNFQYEANLSTYSQFSPVFGVSQSVVHCFERAGQFRQRTDPVGIFSHDQYRGGWKFLQEPFIRHRGILY